MGRYGADLTFLRPFLIFRCSDGDASAGPSTAGPAAPQKTERMVQIPEKDAGRVIGRGGRTLKGLEQRSGATIELPGADGSGFRWAKIKVQ